ncbi:hypothetical protein B0H14DRAFT_2836904 [Mycena olivaceomarginata]|nr:hypothetical protein B0H14DRAFT_2836904 [Mycena olivaceomarginata]
MNYDFHGVENLTMNNHEVQIHDSNIYTVSGDVSLTIQDHRLYDVHVPPHGGNFYHVSGDVNLQTNHHVPAADHGIYGGDFHGHNFCLEDGPGAGSSREPSGVARSWRRVMIVRPTPYDVSYRPQHLVTGPNIEEQSRLLLSSSDALVRSSVGVSNPLEFVPEYLPSMSSSASFLTSDPWASMPNPQLEDPLTYSDLDSDATGSYRHDLTIPTSDQGPLDWDMSYPHPSSELSSTICYPPPEPLQSFHGGTFITTQSVNTNQGETGINILHHAVTLEALYDSAESFPQPRCHPETRTEMLDDLYKWATVDSAHSMCWLHGPAGAGKSAIMQTLCQRLKGTGFLGGAFFFKRGHATRGNAKALFTTLAYQVALGNMELKHLISRSVEIDPSVVGRDMEIQLDKLIVEPRQSLEKHAQLVLLIDGLDECDSEQVQQKILHIIKNTVFRYPSFFRFLVASRPEAHIQEVFKDSAFQGIFKSVNIEAADEDVRTYLCDEFARIHREHRETMETIPTPWPSRDIIQTLVWNSSGYFIYASTVIKFVDDQHFRPTEQLAVIQNLPPNSEFESPFAALDQLYTQILSRVPVRSRDKLCDIMCAVTNFNLPPHHVEHLLELKPGDVRLVLRDLHSLLRIGSGNERISMHHASFFDFLHDQIRSDIFHIGSDHRRMRLAHSVFQAFLSACDDRRIATGDLVWVLSGQSWIPWIMSIPPTAELFLFIQSLQPDWILRPWYGINGDMRRFSSWLKEIRPIPHETIQIWDDYCFMRLFNDLQYFIYHKNYGILHDAAGILSPSLQNLSDIQAQMESTVTIDACRKVLLRTPQLICIFQIVGLLQGTGGEEIGVQNIRILLELSWDDMNAAIRALRSLTGLNPMEIAIVILTLTTLCQENTTRPLVSKDFACRFIRLIRQFPTSNTIQRSISSHVMPAIPPWGQCVRSSPQSSPELLDELRRFVSPWNLPDLPSETMQDLASPFQLHDVVQWLKTLNDPPMDLIEQWEGYLRQSKEQYFRSSSRLDWRWQKREQERQALKASDKKVVQSWLHVLEGIKEGGFNFTWFDEVVASISDPDGSSDADDSCDVDNGWNNDDEGTDELNM